MYLSQQSRFYKKNRKRQLSGKEILIMLEWSDTWPKKKEITELFLKKFQSHPSKNLKIIKINPEQSRDQNFNEIFAQLTKYFDSGQDVYIFFCGQRNNNGDLKMKNLQISFSQISNLWEKRKSSNNLYFFIDSLFYATWHREIMKKKIGDYTQQRNKEGQFAVIQSKFGQDLYQPFFFYIIFGTEQFLDRYYQEQANRQNFIYSTRNKSGEFTIKNLYDLQQSIANIRYIIHPEYDILYHNGELHQPIWISQMYKIFNQQPTKQQSKKSGQLKKKLISLAKEADEKKQQSSIPILALSQFLQRSGNKKGTAQVILYENKNEKTNKTLDILANLSYYTRVLVYEQTIEGTQYKYSFEEIKLDSRKKQHFEQWIKNKIAKKYRVPSQTVQIHQLIYGSIKVKYSIKVEHQPDGNIKTHQFFKYFHLSIDQFSTSGNKVYPNKKGEFLYGMIDRRGGWPYFLPVKCSRYGLNVKGNYDGGNDDWLKMDERPGQWAIAFHGINQPELEKEGLKCLNSLMQGLGKDKTMFKVGPRQVYSSDISLNTAQKIGSGIYCTPHISTAINYYNREQKQKKVMDNKFTMQFQCVGLTLRKLRYVRMMNIG